MAPIDISDPDWITSTAGRTIHVSPKELWQMFSSSDLLDDMLPGYWDRPQSSEITHIVKEIFRQMAIENRWGYCFERPNKHDMAVWRNVVYRDGEKPLFVLESENKQEPEEIEKEIEKLVKSESCLKVGVFYAWPKYNSMMIVEKTKELMRREKSAEKGFSFLLILGYTRRSDRPKNRPLETYGYETYAIDSHTKHALLGKKQIYPKQASARS